MWLVQPTSDEGLTTISDQEAALGILLAFAICRRIRLHTMQYSLFVMVKESMVLDKMLPGMAIVRVRLWMRQVKETVEKE